MSIKKRKPRQLPQVVGRRQLPQAVGRRKLVFSMEPDELAGPASPLLATHASKNRPKAIKKNNSATYSVNEDTRLIRVRVCHACNLLYSAEDPAGVVLAETSRPPIRLGGVFSDYRSNIVVSSEKDLIYFDEIPKFTKYPFAEVVRNASEMEFIGLNLSKIKSVNFLPFLSMIDCDSLDALILVITDENFRGLVRRAQTNELGFREVDDDVVRAQRPELYSKAVGLVTMFNRIMKIKDAKQGLGHMFVFDWERRGD